MSRKLIGAAALALCLMLVPSARAAEEAQVEEPTGFMYMKGTNGYTIGVHAPTPRSRNRGRVEIIASNGGAFAVYEAKARITPDGFESDLGELGRIELEFVPTGRLEPAFGCGNKVTFKRAYFRGLLEFRGEEGFTSVRRTRIPVASATLVRLYCAHFYGYFAEPEPGLPGAMLALAAKPGPRTNLELEVLKNRPSARTLYRLYLRERNEGVAIVRGTGNGFFGAYALEYDASLQTAVLRPPAPFSGTGVFQRGADGAGAWSGDLTVDLPGRSDIPLTGPAFGSSLVSARWTRDSFEGGRRPLASLARQP